MTDEVVARVLTSARYRDVDAALVTRLAAEELRLGRSGDEAVKRVKRRLHQAIGAYRGAAASGVAATLRSVWTGEWTDEMRAACLAALERHVSTRERIGELDRFYPLIWEAAGGTPASVLDLACGMNPFALPFMGLAPDATYVACDADHRLLREVEAFLSLVDQPHVTVAHDLVQGPPDARAEVALLLKTVTLLERQSSTAVSWLIDKVRANVLVASIPTRSLGRRGNRLTDASLMERTLAESRRIGAVRELTFDTERVWVMGLASGA